MSDYKLKHATKHLAEMLQYWQFHMRQRENFICQVKTTIFNIIVNYNSRLPEKGKCPSTLATINTIYEYNKIMTDWIDRKGANKQKQIKVLHLF